MDRWMNRWVSEWLGGWVYGLLVKRVTDERMDGEGGIERKK